LILGFPAGGIAVRVLVTGSRTFNDCILIEEVLGGIYAVHAVGWQVADLEPLYLAHGGARGADSLANMWATSSPLHGPVFLGAIPEDVDLWSLQAAPVVLGRYPADWVGPCDPSFCQPGHRRFRRGHSESYCPAAGVRRNQHMLDAFKPDRVEGFLDKPERESHGTHDMLTRARSAGVYNVAHHASGWRSG
jgi:hypothetical protein